MNARELVEAEVRCFSKGGLSGEVFYDRDREKRRGEWWRRLVGHYRARYVFGDEEDRSFEELGEKARADLIDKDVRAEIAKDLDRTHTELSKDQEESLRHILECYAIRNKNVGYCQGMNEIGALLLREMGSEKDAFWGLVLLLEHILVDYHVHDMLGQRVDHLVLRSLLSRHRKELHDHLVEIAPNALFFPTWSVSLFVGVLSMETVLQVWDVVLAVGANRGAGESVRWLFAVCMVLLDNVSEEVLEAREEADAERIICDCCNSAKQLDTRRLIQLSRACFHDIQEEDVVYLRMRFRGLCESVRGTKDGGSWTEHVVQFGPGELGLNLRYNLENDEIVVAGFSRGDTDDSIVLQAESSGQVLIGDIVTHINATRVQNMKSVHETLASSRNIGLSLCFKRKSKRMNTVSSESTVPSLASSSDSSLSSMEEPSSPSKGSQGLEDQIPLADGEQEQCRVFSGDVWLVQQWPNSKKHTHVHGQILLTNYRLIFHGRGRNRNFVVEVPMLSIAKIDSLNGKTLVFHSKDTLRMRLHFKTKEIAEGLVLLCKPLCFEKMPKAYAFSRRLTGAGWDVYDPEQDYRRIGFFNYSRFKLIRQLDTYDLCQTYPRQLIVARNATESEIAQSCTFRSRGRIPVAVWMHPSNGAILARCAQPFVGLRNSRCREDEKLVYELMIGKKNCASISRSNVSTSGSSGEDDRTRRRRGNGENEASDDETDAAVETSSTSSSANDNEEDENGNGTSEATIKGNGEIQKHYQTIDGPSNEEKTKSSVVSFLERGNYKLASSAEGVTQYLWSSLNSWTQDESRTKTSTENGGTVASSSSLGFSTSNGNVSIMSTSKNGTFVSNGTNGSTDSQEDQCSYFIIDARSQVATIGNRALGKGTENPINYPGSYLKFMSIDNIHAVRTSFSRLVELAQPGFSGSNFARALADTGWMDQVRSVIEASVETVSIVDRKGKSVLTHCSDGWDRTAQMVSMAELLLDPFYRTARGFAILVEKEWCSFGHKFKDRYGHGSGRYDDERSPVFVLWVDCIWQTLRQFPHAFEFNELFLITMLDHVHSGRYGTFLCNSSKEREQLRVRERTESVWSLLLFDKEFMNADYKPVNGTIYPSTHPKALRLWERYYFRHDYTFESSTLL